MAWRKNDPSFTQDAGDYAKAQGDFAKAQAELASQKAADADTAAASAKYEWKGTLTNDAALAAVNGMQEGDVYRITNSATNGNLSRTVRYDGTAWVTTDLQDPTAINTLTVQLAETELELMRFKTPLEYGVLKLPSDFPTLPFGIYRDVDGLIKHDFDFDKFNQNITRTYYISKSTGLDSNNGTSESTPLKTIEGVFWKMGSTTGQNVLVVFLESATFTFGEVSGGTLGSTISVRSNNRFYFKTKNPTDRVICTAGIPTLSWALEPGYTKTYKATHTANLQTFLDLRKINRDVYGLPKNYQKKTSIADVEGTPGSFYVNGMTIYVHALDGIIPNNVDMMANVTSFGFRFSMFDGSKLIFENMDLFGANTYFDNATTVGTEHTEIWSNNCRASLNNSNNFASNNQKRVYHFNLISGYAKRDGINFTFSSISPALRRECLGFEYNCKSYRAGIDEVTDNNNATTCHDGGCVLRIGTTAFECAGPVLADVHGCYSIGLDIKIRDSIAVNVANRKVMVFDNTGALLPGKSILVNSSSMGASDNVLLSAPGNLELKLQHFLIKEIPEGLNVTYVDRIAG